MNSDSPEFYKEEYLSYYLESIPHLDENIMSSFNEFESLNKSIHFEIYKNNIDDLNYQKDVNTKKSVLFKTVKLNESLIFHIMKNNNESIDETKSDSLKDNNLNTKNKKNQKESKNWTTNNHQRKKKKKNSNKRRRRDNTDNIRTKIFTMFFKYLKSNINNKLKSAGCHKFFKPFPIESRREFIHLIIKAKKNKNIKAADLTFHEIFSKYFCENVKVENLLHKKYYENNLEVLRFLEENKDISQKIKFDLIKKSKFSQILNEFLMSLEYQNEIECLKKEDEKYTERFDNKIREILYYFSN